MKKLIFGIILCVAALVVPALLLIPIISALTKGVLAFEAPGELEVTVEEPGRYYVWNDYETIHQGRTYSRTKSLPDGVTFSLSSGETGEKLSFRTDLSISSSSGQERRSSVGFFEVEEPRVYVLAIEGLDQARIFSFGPSIFDDFGRFFGGLLLGFLLVVAVMIGGILLIVFGIIDLVRKNKEATPPSSASEIF